MDDYLATSNFTCDLVNNLDSSFEGDRSSGEFSPNSEDSHTTESRVTFSYHDEFDYEEMYDPDSRVSFYEKDFEEVYKELHAEDLAQRSKDELIGNIQEMEQRLLSYELAEKLHSNTVLDLQSELDFLVEENKRLKEKSFVWMNERVICYGFFIRLWNREHQRTLNLFSWRKQFSL